MEPLRPAGLPPLSVGTGPLSGPTGSKKPAPQAEKEQKAEKAEHAERNAEQVVEEKESPFECTMGTRGVTQLTTPAPKKSMADLEETLRTASMTAVVKGSGRRWIRGEAIGRGSLGTVFQAMDQQTGELLAVKEKTRGGWDVLGREVGINTSDKSDLKFKEQLENEIQMMKDLKHPRIVTYFGHDYIGDCLYIYLEYMAGGSLAQALKQFGCFEESLTLSYAKEILEGLEYLHTHDPPVVHRDIKGGNVLVDLECHAKLSDFGCSKRANDTDTLCLTMRGSIPWMAPEVIKSTGYGRKADIWSYGCVLIEMATGKNPWGSFDNPMAAMVKIGMSEATPPIPETLSPAAKDIIRLCTQRDATLRPDATSLLSHEALQNVGFDD
eukprot:Skav234278  [mRNA]  locus=scaffold1464:1275640:1277216:- [translate_table: standard]